MDGQHWENIGEKCQYGRIWRSVYTALKEVMSPNLCFLKVLFYIATQVNQKDGYSVKLHVVSSQVCFCVRVSMALAVGGVHSSVHYLEFYGVLQHSYALDHIVRELVLVPMGWDWDFLMQTSDLERRKKLIPALLTEYQYRSTNDTMDKL